MWKIIISIACLVAVTAGTASVDNFIGEWVPLAIYPDLISPDEQVCVKFVFAKTTGNLQCTDSRKFELLETRLTNMTVLNGVGLMPVDDLSIVTPTFRVTCAYEGKDVDVLLVAKLINKDYALLYRLDSIPSNNNPHSIWIYGRNIPTRADLTTFVNSVDELRGKKVGTICASD